MGYKVYNTLEVEDKSDSKAIEEFWRTNDLASMCLDKDGKTNERSNGYLSGELKEFSPKHPTVVFCLTCVGEDGDQWMEYHQNGKSYQESLIKNVPNFNSNNLK